MSFSAQVARGLIRDPRMRRRTMFVLLLVAMLMVFLGVTFLEAPLNPREHVGWFLLFWCACAWLTITALLLAIFDMLALRREARAARSAFRANLAKEAERSED
ncbi:MAG: hypothetical protein ACXWFY_01490 [Chthoniobacterales bacterium]